MTIHTHTAALYHATATSHLHQIQEVNVKLTLTDCFVFFKTVVETGVGVSTAAHDSAPAGDTLTLHDDLTHPHVRQQQHHCKLKGCSGRISSQ